MNTINRFYKYLTPIFIIICFVFFYYCWYINTPLTTVILVRHADRTGTVDQLNADGLSRAQELSRILDELDISAIYVSTANRTQQTANPIAAQLSIPVEIYNAGNLNALVDDITSNHKGEIILIVGHSNTVGPTMGLLGVTPTPPDIPHDEFDHLYIVTRDAHSIPRMLKMEYGADTP